MKACSYDNAVAEATFKIIKTEFVYPTTFDSLDQITIEFCDYVNWFNKIRIHGTLGYVSPEEYKQSFFKKAI
ncbi:IS3 family transposase [Shimazuella sp. KC615]|uniref:IS3 family transposase n=1 Tax=Shimazuella alba TaxID=2690964 RepID=A0A6I4W1A0_9BACL|nr:IS3 family transposase [Shimazuella alba]MXQ54022.1 IS3 family transposase [Shimazuella alba]